MMAFSICRPTIVRRSPSDFPPPDIKAAIGDLLNALDVIWMQLTGLYHQRRNQETNWTSPRFICLIYVGTINLD